MAGLALVAAVAGCSAAREPKLSLSGSSTVAPLAAEIAKRYEASHLGSRVDVQTGGSSRGIADARSGTAQIGLVSRALKPEEADLQATTIAIDGIARRALQRVDLWEEVKDRLGRPASELSGGQQQRLCLARALVLEPEVLLLDDPCSALDRLASAVVEELVASLRGSVTILIVTHNLAKARRLADDVAVFWNCDGVGYPEEQGSADAVFASPRSPISAAYLEGARG